MPCGKAKGDDRFLTLGISYGGTILSYGAYRELGLCKFDSIILSAATTFLLMSAVELAKKSPTAANTSANMIGVVGGVFTIGGLDL